MDWGQIVKAGGSLAALALSGATGGVINQETRDPDVELQPCTNAVVLEFMSEQLGNYAAKV